MKKNKLINWDVPRFYSTLLHWNFDTLSIGDEDTSLVDVSKLSSVLDTSVTSTIDATSIFSGGGGFQRSNSLDDNYSIIGSIPEEDEEELDDPIG